jgi:chaperonin GroEL
MVVNTVQGHVQTVAVKAPDFGERMLEQLKDIASVTGGKVLSQGAGEGVKDIGWPILGNVSKVVVTKTSITLTQDEDVSKSVEGRARSIRAALENATLDLDKEWLQKRLARLLGGVVSIQVGAQTEVELGELRDRVEDALSATRAAVEEGVVPGGGVALLRCMAEMADRENLEEGDESLGYLLVRNALSAPVKQIAANAGEEGAVIVEDLLHCDLDTVYNAQTSGLVDAFDEGIIDPVKVTKSAISNAASVAGMLLTTECVIHTDYEEGR